MGIASNKASHVLPSRSIDIDSARVSAVSGALLVRNAEESLVTRLQDLEYRLSLILAKIGLSEFNIINNVSGAFGIFRRTVLLAAGGWNTGTAEDLDLTLRLKHYTKRNHQRIAFEPQAIGFTDVPNTWIKFFKQRLRWDGDLIFLYLRKHWQTFRPRLIGWRNYLILVWGGLLFQLISPFVIAGYLAWLAFIYPLPQFLAIFFFIFFFYLVITSTNLVFYLIVGSRQPLKDIRFFIYIPVFTLFVCALRLWNVVTTLNELFRLSHQESAMAPWWVLKRPGKY